MASPPLIPTLALALMLCRTGAPLLAQPTSVVAGAESVPLEAGIDLDVKSLYVHRGMVYSDGPVTQLTAWGAVNALYLYAWSNVAVPAAAGAKPLDEVDLGAAYGFERGAFRIEPAFDLYLYRLTASERADGIASGTAEMSATVSYAANSMEFFVRHVVDSGSFAGAYLGTVGVRHDRALTSRTAVGASVSLGWASRRYNQAYIGPSRAGLNLVAVRASVTRLLGRLRLATHIDLTTVPGAALRRHLASPSVVVVGLSLGVVR